MRLFDMLKGLDYVLIKGSDLEIEHITYSSREVVEGSLFFCIEGFRTDGHQFIQDAVNRGAKAIIVSKDVNVEEDVTIVKVKDTREAMAIVSSNFYGNPSKFFNVIGVTGTNGKTTSTFMIKSILDEYNRKTALLGTIYNIIGEKIEEAKRTTPESMDLQRLYSEMKNSGITDCIMEVSSHSLELKRVYGVEFKVGIFTNLTQDHLDFHKTMENYFNAKMKLFENSENCIINIDDEYGKRAAEMFKNKRVITYGIDNRADIMAENLKIDSDGSQFNLVINGVKRRVKLHLPGKFNVYNALGCIGAAIALNIPVDIAIKGLEKLQSVPGRSEKIVSHAGFTVVIDYAHTPDGIENILKAAREYTSGRLITLFGCGGDRDKGKRPLMGKAAGELSDFCIITSDNPRSEDPMAIINDIIPGIDQTGCKYIVIEDRKKAIEYAIKNAKKGDVIVVAGKGHEKYQILKDRTIEFDERKIVEGFLKEIITTDDIIKATCGKVFNLNENIIINKITTDSRKVEKADVFIALKGEKFDGHDFLGEVKDKGAVCAVVSKFIPNVDIPQILVDDTLRAYKEIARYYRRRFDIPIVAITGSCGKTTTKEMIASVLSSRLNVHKTEKNFNNEIGLPMTILNLKSKHEASVVEMGMNHFGEIESLSYVALPKIAVITNIGTAHIENLGSRENILKAKMEITTYFNEENILVINSDDDMLSTVKTDKYKIIKFAINSDADYKAYDIIDLGQDGMEFKCNISGVERRFKVNLPGQHNIYNALSAIAVGDILGLQYEDIYNGILNFNPGSMRMNIVELKDDIKFIVDCYNANPDSMKAAIDVLNKFNGRRIAVLGDMFELGEFSKAMHKEVGNYLVDKCDVLIAIGEFAKEYYNEAMGKIECYYFINKEEAFDFIKNFIKRDDVVLFKASRGMKLEYISDSLIEQRK
ncbi:hypothetical protein TCEA9_08100 [Thermobrachium celere]|nr:hypothetical protein TCEA9_08100 [Thermobrachium celere]